MSGSLHIAMDESQVTACGLPVIPRSRRTTVYDLTDPAICGACLDQGPKDLHLWYYVKT